MHLSHRYALAVTLAPLVLTLFAGCGQPVREDRSINWSKGGEGVGFQHGREGVFLADKDGRKLTKIFQPDSGVIATSTPVWSPTGKRLLFTTARSASGPPPVSLSVFGDAQDPAGNIHLQHDIRYTCWLCEQTDDGTPTEPEPLFESTADHPGYVAANLAVRWNPNSAGVDYIRQIGPHQIGLFEFDLASKKSRRIFPHASAALVFDWIPHGSELVCLLGSSAGSMTDGMWIGRPATADWWHVPDSANRAPGSASSLLENLRSMRPAWTSDGNHFAYSSYHPGAPPQRPGWYSLYQGRLSSRTVELWAEGDRIFRDLQWDRSGDRLGVVCGDEDGTLHLVQKGQPLLEAVNREPVRRFLGWSADGERLAYVVPDDASTDAAPWALLLQPNPGARDKVYVATGDGTEPGRPVFSGMRVTFPQWSPRDDKLSLWVTFLPAYRSVISQMLGWGLRPGDPAAVFDLKTQRLDWMPVNAQEMVQVGHYFLLKRDYAQAWHWYQEAEAKMPPPAPVAVHDFMDYVRALQGPRDFGVFEFYCLSKLGRPVEAQAKLDRFRRVFLPKFADPAGGQAAARTAPGGETLEDQLHELLDPSKLVGALLQDLYVAEVFLSLDAAEDGESFFRAALNQADTEQSRLSRAIALGQILLLRAKLQDYAELATATITPLLIKMFTGSGGPPNILNTEGLPDFVGEMTLLPLGARDFLAQLPDDKIQDITGRWEKLSVGASDRSRPLIDLVQQGLYERLGRQAGLRGRPVANRAQSTNDDAGKRIVAWRVRLQEVLSRW